MIEDATRYRGSEVAGGSDATATPGGVTRRRSGGQLADITPKLVRPPGALPVAPPLSLAELARRFGEMAWLEARLYEVVGWWSSLEHDDALAVLFAEISRHHGWHAELWQSALPDADALVPMDQIGPPHDGWIDFFQALVELGDPDASADRVAALALVVDPWLRVRNDQLTAAINPISDRAVARIQRFVLLDHVDDHETLIAALTRLPGGPTSAIPDQLFPLIGDNH